MTDAEPRSRGPGRRPAWVSAVDDRPVLLVVLGMLLFSVGPVLVGASTGSGAVLSFYRLWFGAALLVAVLLWRRRSRVVRTSRRGWWWAVLTGVAFGIHQLLFMLAIKATSVVDVTLMQVLAPVLVGVLARVLFGERTGAAFRLWSGLAVAGAGLVVVAGTAGPEGRPAGMALAFASVVLAAFYVVWSKRAMSHIDALPFLSGVAVVAAVAVSAYVLVAGEPVAAVGSRDVLIAAAIAIGPGTLGHFLSTYPLSRISANIPPVIQLAMPVISGVLAWALLGQGITVLHVVGGAVSIAGVVGALSSRGGRQLRAASRTPACREPGAGPGPEPGSRSAESLRAGAPG